MFKTKEEIIIIQAEAKEPIATRAVFWSHDKGTAKMLFKLRKDSTSQSLTEGTIVPVVLDFNSETAENGRGRHIYHAVIEDAVNGIVSIVLEDNILGYQGRVDGSIYIELPDSRSLDTAGRFTFHIKRSPIDEDVPELEDYYWQGFSDIMEQYHESIAEIKLEAKTTLDSLTADVNTAQNKVTTLEQSITTANTNLNTRIDEINKKIDDNDVFTKAESSANVIDQVGGAESAILKKELLVDGTEAVSWRNNGISLEEFKQEDYEKLTDNETVKSETFVSGLPGEIQIDFDVLGIIEKKYPSLFAGLDTVNSKVNKLKTYVKASTCSAIARGGFGSQYTARFAMRPNGSTSTWWGAGAWNATSEFRQIRYYEFTANILSPTGHSIYRIYSNNLISDGVASAYVEVKDIRLTIELEVNGRTIITSMIAQNHVTNLATTDEAKAGTNTTKTMTPATTAQAVDNRAVTLASNQTVGGIKNFKDGLMLNGQNVLTETAANNTYQKKAAGAIVWAGTSTLNADHTITPSKKLSECNAGWLLVFAPYNGAEVQNYDVTTVFVPKNQTRLSITQIFNGSVWIQKRYQCTDSVITGHSSNVGTEQIKAALIEVREV
ncbi:BppU family phage baseplate upper protein [Enterococcus hailinensis]|uniref:BppU family phage baseplate upper protein n=1 Tax=Enterococcus hailinensis TaxID=3238988 RepID=UPI0038B31448